MGDRAEILGFVPQKELVYNKLLQYGDELDNESQKYLVEIKTNLGKSVQCQDLRDVIYWTNHLARFIRLYGRKFSKEDHINFIKVYFELLMIPDVESSFVNKIAVILHILLKKSDLISREDLVLPWRPLYELSERLFFSTYENVGMMLNPSNLDAHLKNLIKDCCKYFSVESTQEVLDEFWPCMCPFDTETVHAMSGLEYFLCTTIPPQDHDKGYKLWFFKLMEIWESWKTIPAWETSLVNLLARLAKDNIGYIDWEPYIPTIFTRLLRSFNLPGRNTRLQVYRVSNAFDSSATSVLIASMLGMGNSCQLHITRLFKALESFYHPSNHGRWLVKMQKLLQRLPLAVTKRLHREKHIKPSWKTQIPDRAKLTNEDVTEFVRSIVPSVLLSMFSKRGCHDSSIAVQHLGALRPELVIPPLLERMYSSFETITEPHRLTASMHCIVPVCRQLVQSNKHFPEGPGHVIPLLMASLPGMDPNDIKKCMFTFQFISTLANLILIVDCSSAVDKNPNLPQNVQDVCLATAVFEDFVLQFMDRCFALIENSCLDGPNRLDRESERTNPEEHYTEIGLYSTFAIIVNQCSPAIFDVALKKLHTFVTTHILEVNVSGKSAAHMCRVVTKINPELGLKTFVPHFSKLVLTLTESEDIVKEEKLDDELLFSLLILSETVRCNGKNLLEYQSCIIKVLERTLDLSCKKGYKLACALLTHTLKAYLAIYPLNTSSVPNPWSRHSSDNMHHYLNDWGVSGNIHKLELEYHEPSDEEVEAAKFLIKKFLLPELEKFSKVVNKEISMKREHVQRSLAIILSVLVGGACSFPMWDEPQMDVRETTLPPFQPFPLYCRFKDINLDGQNVRKFVCDIIRKLLVHIFETCEDDTKSLFEIIRIFNALMFNWGMEKEEYEAKSKGFRFLKNALENKLYGEKKHIRSLLIDRVHLQHEFRVSERYKPLFTLTHTVLMQDLLKLSTSHYAEVRQRAQVALHNCLSVYCCSGKVIFNEIIELLKKDPINFHEEFKGVLHVVLGHKKSTLLTVQSWEILSELWPAIVSSKHSEKPSIIKLLDAISTCISKNFTTNQIKLVIPKICINATKCFWEQNPLPNSSCFTEKEILQFTIELSNRSDNKERLYLKLVNSLITLLKHGNLHWRHYHLAVSMLGFLIRHDIQFPAEGVDLFVNHLIHDTLAVRKMAIHSMSALLKQVKREHPKIVIDPTMQNPKNPVLHPLIPKTKNGKIPENFWLMYNSLDLPDTEEKWNSRHFVHKTFWSVTCWPKEFKVPAPDSQQPKLDRTYEELSENEKPIYEAFTQKKFVDRLIHFLSLEEKKGQDKFSAKTFFLFKNLFTRFGDTFLPLFIDHLNEMAGSKTESIQRCCAEIVAGLLHACKHWNFHMMHKAKELLTPVLEKAISNVFPDTLADWTTCVATISGSRDPNKYYWFFELLMKEPQSIESGSFLESSWISLLVSSVSQQEWRGYEMLHRALDYIKPKLDHSYQNVREQLGCLLAFIFVYDVPCTHVTVHELAPKRIPFINSILPKLDVLEPSKHNSESNIQNCVELSPEKKRAENLFRTICRWITINGTKLVSSVPPEMFKFLPLLCHVMHETVDDELKRECSIAMLILGQSLLSPQSIDAAVETIQQISSGTTWHSRVSAASYLQQMVFANLYTVMLNNSWTKTIYDIVLTLLEDEIVEVRESAAETLCGFLHCEYFKLTDELLNTFKLKSQRKLAYRTTSNNGPRSLDPNELRHRHAGVLGLCACVNAFPYDVPEFLPEILVLLGDHLNDPQPISATIKKTLSSFRRTHHDNWRDHKLKFTDDQLAVITDLLVSPSYYA